MGGAAGQLVTRDQETVLVKRACALDRLICAGYRARLARMRTAQATPTAHQSATLIGLMLISSRQKSIKGGEIPGGADGLFALDRVITRRGETQYR